MKLETLLLYAEIGVKVNLEKNNQMLEQDSTLANYLPKINKTLQENLNAIHNAQHMLDEKVEISKVIENILA